MPSLKTSLFGLLLPALGLPGSYRAERNSGGNKPDPDPLHGVVDEVNTDRPDLDPHRHVVDVVGAEPPDIPEFATVEAEVDTSLVREEIIENKARSRQAFLAYTPATRGECSHHRLFVEDMKSGIVCEIQGLSLGWRPFSDLVWGTNDILVFDRWSQPHHGIHYAIDLREKKVRLASPFTDRL